MRSNDSMIKKHCIHVDAFETGMIDQYGDRYRKYREDYAAAGHFKYVPDFPLYLMLEQTFKCNLICKSCIHGMPAERDKYVVDNPIMSLKLLNKILNEAHEYQCPSISFHSNDEPLLVSDLADRITLAKDHGFMDIILTTNGTLLSKQLLSDIIDAGVTRILFSLDAATRQTYLLNRGCDKFDDVISNLRMVHEFKKDHKLAIPVTRVSFVISKHNEHEKDLFIDTFRDLVDYIDIQPLSTYYDFNTDLVSSKSKKVTDFRCNETWRKLIVRPNGDVLPCCSFYGYDIILGNCNSDSLWSIFNSETMTKFREECATGSFKRDICKSCSDSFYVCGDAGY